MRITAHIHVRARARTSAAAAYYTNDKFVYLYLKLVLVRERFGDYSGLKWSAGNTGKGGGVGRQVGKERCCREEKGRRGIRTKGKSERVNRQGKESGREKGHRD